MRVTTCSRIACSSEVSSLNASLNASLAARMSSIGASRSAVLPPLATVFIASVTTSVPVAAISARPGKRPERLGLSESSRSTAQPKLWSLSLLGALRLRRMLNPPALLRAAATASRQPLSVSTCSALASFAPSVLAWTVGDRPRNGICRTPA